MASVWPTRNTPFKKAYVPLLERRHNKWGENVHQMQWNFNRKMMSLWLTAGSLGVTVKETRGDTNTDMKYSLNREVLHLLFYFYFHCSRVLYFQVKKNVNGLHIFTDYRHDGIYGTVYFYIHGVFYYYRRCVY